LMGALVVVLWLTGSRSSFIAAMVGLALMLTHVRRLNTVALVGLHLVAAGLTYIVLVTNLFASFLSRGGSGGLSTLNSRTIAWSAAFEFSDSAWVQWFGAGLSTKEIPVSGQFWNTQVLDSSWISGLVQAGRIGAALLVIWAIWALVVSRQGPTQQRMLLTPLLVYLVIRSTLESGLIDSTVSFTVFFIISLVGERTVLARHSHRFRIGSRTGSWIGPMPDESESWPAPVAADLVVINGASVEELQQLSGIGPAAAVAIVQDRERHGDFQSIEDVRTTRRR